jgi:hypothetical protein
VTSRDRALDVLQKFDAAVARQRQELKEELVAGSAGPPDEFDQQPGEAVPGAVIAAAQELQESLPPPRSLPSADGAN